MDKVTLTRRELYELVWAEPLLTLSKRYQISDVGLRKICISMQIPLPKAGHWQKIKAGKRVKVSALSSAYTGKDTVSLKVRSMPTSIDLSHPSPLLLLEKEILSQHGHLLLVPKRLTNPDALIQAAKDNLEQKTTRYNYTDLISTSLNIIDIRVSKESVRRALRLMDTFIKVLRARGHQLQSGYPGFDVLIGEETFQVSLREKLNRTIVKGQFGNSTEDKPSGRLILKLGSYPAKEWSDGKLPLEQKLANIIAYLELQAREKAERKIARQIEREADKERERIRQELLQRQQEELNRFKTLLQEAQRWQQVKQLRSYIAERRLLAESNNQVSPDFEAWLLWANQKADWYDPHVQAKDELLDAVDKGTLTLGRKGNH